MQVYLGVHKESGEAVAIKCIAKAGKSPEEAADIQNEIEILKCLDHPNIVKLLNDFETPEDYCLVTELATGQHHAITMDWKMPRIKIERYCLQSQPLDSIKGK